MCNRRCEIGKRYMRILLSMVLLISVICSSAPVMAATDSTASPEKTIFRKSQVTDIEVMHTSVYGILLNWKALKYADDYTVYRASTKNGEYKNLGATVMKAYIDEDTSPGKTYYYKVVGSGIFDGELTYSKDSVIITASAIPQKVSFSTSTGTDAINIKVSRADIVSGYAIYSSTSKDGEYEKLTTLKQQNKITYKVTGLKKGTTYYFKVRAYSTMKDGKVYWGDYSAVKSVAFGDSNKLALSKENIKNYKTEADRAVQMLLQDENFWNPNHESSIDWYEIKSISFVDFGLNGTLELVVRSSTNDDNINHIRVYNTFFEGCGSPYVFEKADYSYDNGINLTFKAYKDKKKNQFFLANVSYDQSGASGQIGTRVNEYYATDNTATWEMLMGSYYTLNYHKVVDYENGFIFKEDKISESEYKKSKKAYFDGLTALSFKETIVPYSSSMSDSEKKKAIKKAYEAFYK